jgi:hypothetical protein
MRQFFALCGAFGIASMFSAAAWAQDNSSSASTSFFISQKIWWADWGFGALGSRLLPPTAENPAPRLQAYLVYPETDHVMPITTVGARIDRWTLSASLSPSTRFETSGLYGGSVRRKEYDLNLGYAVNSSIGLALIYKAGEVDVRAPVDSFDPASLSSGQKLHAVLVGMSANAPVSDTLTVYGSVAYGPRGRAKFELEAGTEDVKYTIAEAGISYRLPVSFANLSVQAGYRYQGVKYEDVVLPTFALTPAPVEISQTTGAAKSTTKGFFAGISVAF